jgi:hypothetical protein
VAEARAKGLSVVDVVKAHLAHVAPVEDAKHLSAADVERGFDEAADLIPEEFPPLSDEALSRDGIYTREDDWNR